MKIFPQDATAHGPKDQYHCIMQTALQLSGLQLPRSARISPWELGLSGGTTYHTQFAMATLGEVSEAQP